MKPNREFLELYKVIEEGELSTLAELLTVDRYRNALAWDENREDYEPLLEYAVRCGDIKIVKRVLTTGVGLPLWNQCLKGAMEVAAENGRLDLVELLFSNGYSEKEGRSLNPLIRAMYSSKISVIRYFLNRGFNPNCTDEEGHTPLMLACSQGSLERVKLLIDFGADTSMIDSTGWRTAMIIAQQRNRDDIVRFLLHREMK